MSLPGYLTKRFRKALEQAYPDEDKLRLMLVEECGEKYLDQITTANGLSAKIADVIRDADARGWLPQLVRGSLLGNKDSPPLLQFVALLLDRVTVIPPLPPITQRPVPPMVRLIGWVVILAALSGAAGFGIAAAVGFANGSSSEQPSLPSWTLGDAPSGTNEGYGPAYEQQVLRLLPEPSERDNCGGPFLISFDPLVTDAPLRQLCFFYDGKATLDATLFYRKKPATQLSRSARPSPGVAFDVGEMDLHEGDELYALILLRDAKGAASLPSEVIKERFSIVADCQP